VAISFYRKDSKRKTILTELSDSFVEIVSEHDPPPNEDQFNQLQKFIAELKEVDRMLTILYLKDKSQKEIAEIMGITETNVFTKMLRIKEHLGVKFQLNDQ